MMPSLNPYLHGLFAILLYLVGNFFTIIILEYKLKNVNLKHTLAGFACVALSGFIVYFVPIFLFGIKSSTQMLVVGLVSAGVVQIIFWWFWFQKDLKKFAPVLLLAFILTTVISLLVYNLFVWYIEMVAKDAMFTAAQKAARAVGGAAQAIKGAAEVVPAVGDALQKVF